MTRDIRPVFEWSAPCSTEGMLTDPFGTIPLTKTIIGCAIRVHRDMGPGVYEKVDAERLLLS